MANDGQLSLLEHLEELRKRLIRIVILFMLALIIGFLAADPVVDYIRERPPANEYDWHVFAPSDALGIYLKVAFVISFVFISPLILFEIWGFVSPGLSRIEKRNLLSYIPVAVLLFIVGIGFGYYILFPMVLTFMTNIANQLDATETYGMAEYFQFLVNIVFPFGLLFQLPIVVMFLASVGIINPIQLGKFRRYAYFLLVVVSVSITPPDIASDFLVTIPLILLYEISILLTCWIYRKKWRKEHTMTIKEPHG